MSARKNPGHREQIGKSSRNLTSEERVPVAATDSQEPINILQEGINLLENLVDDVLEAENLDSDACSESARRIDDMMAALKASRNRLANAGRDRERLTRLAEVQDRQFRRVPGWPAYDVDRDGQHVRSYYGLDRTQAPHPYRLLSTPPDPETGLPTVKLCRNQGEHRRVAIADLAREVWKAAGSHRNSGGYDDSFVVDELNARTRRR